VKRSRKSIKELENELLKYDPNKVPCDEKIAVMH